MSKQDAFVSTCNISHAIVNLHIQKELDEQMNHDTVQAFEQKGCFRD